MGQLIYTPGVFKDLYNESNPEFRLYEHLWDFINSYEAEIKMKVSSDLGKTAVEILQQDLLEGQETKYFPICTGNDQKAARTR